MLRSLIVVVVLAGCAGPRARLPKAPDARAVLLRYRLKQGERYVTEVRTVRLGRPRVEIVTRIRTAVEAGLRLRSTVLWAGARIEGRPLRAIDVDPSEVATQRVSADRRDVITLADGEEQPFGAGLPTLPARAVPVGRSWQDRRWIARSGTRLLLHATLVSVDAGTGVIALRGVARTDLPRTEDGRAQALVTSIAGERRIDLATGWVGRTGLDLVTSVRSGAGRGQTVRAVERTRIEMCVARDVSE